MNTTNRRYQMGLMVGALGVVYGDIGTSPLYALRECFNITHGVAASADNVRGVVSLIFWSLTLIVSIKYLGLVMRADNKGEGGIIALLSLALPRSEGKKRGIGFLVGLGIFGAALLYGDGVITPAITVLSAVEGLEIVSPTFQLFVVPLAVAILLCLFGVQRFGTGNVGKVFGPVMVAWFLTLAVLGINGICTRPDILLALSPHYAFSFLVQNGRLALIVLGAVFLAVTGAEALYADMGHFGAPAIRRVWFTAVFPGLMLNYLGQGALLLQNPEAAKDPFFLLAPTWLVFPLVGLSTMAAVIASQALIAGAYSLTMQAIQMGYLPRLIIQHTSHSQRGQIYMPQVNMFLTLACVGLVLGFQSSSRLAGAYGIAVSLTMLITSVLFLYAAKRIWNWGSLRASVVCGIFILLELVFLAANGLKLWQGGWFPLVVGFLAFAQMTTWKKGRESLRTKLSESYLPFDQFLKSLKSDRLHRVPGTAIFLAGNPSGTPVALLHNLKHNKVLHQRIVILTVLTEDVPYVPDAQRLQVQQLREDIFRVMGHYGFMEQPDVPALLNGCASQGLKFKEMETTFFLSRETIIPHKRPGMALWRRRLFAAMSRNAQSATTFFKLPPNRVVELGIQVEV